MGATCDLQAGQGNPTAQPTRRLAKRVAGELKAAAWRLKRVLSDNANEFRGPAFRQVLKRLGVRHSRIHAGRPQTNENLEALHKTILDEAGDQPSRAASMIGPRSLVHLL